MALEIVNKRDDLVVKSTEDLTSSIPNIQKDIWKNILMFLKELDIDKEGKIKTTSKNIKSIHKFVNRDVKKIIKNSDYPNKVEDFIATFDEAGDLTKKYFDKLDA